MNIQYDYNVAGETHHSNRIGAANHYQSVSTKADAEELIHQYPLNSTVKVYYDPVHPEYSVLIPGVKTSGSIDPKAIPLILLTLFIACVVYQKKHHRR